MTGSYRCVRYLDTLTDGCQQRRQRSSDSGEGMAPRRAGVRRRCPKRFERAMLPRWQAVPSSSVAPRAGTSLPEFGATRSLEPIILDVTDEASIEEALGHVGDRLTAVVNNAGVAVGGPVAYLEIDEWRRQY